MCAECGCGQVGKFGVQPLQAPPENRVRLVGETQAAAPHDHEHTHSDGTPHNHPHDHGHDHAHQHGHEHAGHLDHVHTHTHTDGTTHSHPHHHDPALSSGEPKAIHVGQPILAHNERQARRNRDYLKARGMLALNVLASPGAGKTMLIEKTVAALERDLPSAVIVGDLATANDAQRIRAAGAPVVQITTGTVCHLDSEMVARGLEQLDLAGRRLLVVENVGNLVCPADFDLGEDIRVVLLSVTEGEDKPLKYPPMFRSAHVVIITKMDLAAATGCDLEALRRNVRAVAPQARVFELSARSGEGMPRWLDWLRNLQTN